MEYRVLSAVFSGVFMYNGSTRRLGGLGDPSNQNSTSRACNPPGPSVAEEVLPLMMMMMMMLVMMMMAERNSVLPNGNILFDF